MRQAIKEMTSALRSSQRSIASAEIMKAGKLKTEIAPAEVNTNALALPPITPADIGGEDTAAPAPKAGHARTGAAQVIYPRPGTLDVAENNVGFALSREVERNQICR